MIEIKKALTTLIVSAGVLLTGCNSIDTMKSNAENVASKITNQNNSSSQGGLTLGESGVSTTSAEDKTEKIIYGVNGADFGVYTNITDAKLSIEPNKVSLKLIVGDSFSVEESFIFTNTEVNSEEGTSSSNEESQTENEQVVTNELTIRIGTIDSFQKVFDYLDRGTFENVKFTNKDNAYIAELKQSYLLTDAPCSDYVSCKVYCEEVHTKIREAIDNSKRIRDGSTGIIYHNIGGNEFNLVKYRYQVRRGETAQIEIQDIPEGFTTEDVTFHSDKVGYARVAGDGTITGVNNGSATITVSLRGAAVYRTVYVQVY